MKEVSIEQKAKRYDEAFERVKELLSRCRHNRDRITMVYRVNDIESIFPELKKSEDEKIKEDLIQWISEFPDMIWRGHYREDVITWLKRQDKSALEVIKEENVDNQKCVKSVYNVEPKFKVGDWICNDMCDVHIASIENGMYYFDEGDGLSIVFVDEHYHLWTIEDAMDGDVLCCESGWTCIFKTLNSDNISFSSYCFMDNTGWFCETGSESHTLEKAFIKAYNGEIYPSTKEQRDLLFAKMKEAGYEWDAEKKELKKLGQPEVTKTSDQEEIAEIPFGAKDSELQEATYFIPKGFHAEIDDDKVVIKKGEKPAAWSEEDERLCLCLIEEQKEALNNVKNDKYGHSEIISDLKEMYNERISWLKSLKQRIGG